MGDLFDCFPANHAEKVAADPIMRLAYPGVEMRVLASQIPARNPRFAWTIETSRSLVEALFDGKTGRDAYALACEHIRIFFPERWMSPAETVQFMRRLWAHPIRQRAGTRRIDLVTGSPVIITDFSATAVLVLEYPLPVLPDWAGSDDKARAIGA